MQSSKRVPDMHNTEPALPTTLKTAVKQYLPLDVDVGVDWSKSAYSGGGDILPKHHQQLAPAAMYILRTAVGRCRVPDTHHSRATAVVP